MKTFTIRGIDEELHSKLKARAKSEAISVNRWILKTLRQVMGLEKERDHTRVYRDLDFLFGTWSEDEYRAFQESQETFQKIDEEIWQ